jgi:hypothetical protein
MVVLIEDIMLEIEPYKRFYNQVFIGLPFLKMLESLFYFVTNAKELVIFLDVMKCLIRPKRIYFSEYFCYCFSSNSCVLNTTNTD